MKLRTLFERLGLRAAPKTYGYRIDTFSLRDEIGEVRFAQWLHPKCRPMRFDSGAIDALRTHIRPGDGVIDIGAHAGDTSVLFALAAGPQGHVFAVEPNRYVLPVLRANAGLNPAAAPITVLPYAAADRRQTLVFDYSDSGFCNGGDLSQFGSGRRGHLYRLEVEARDIAEEIRDTAPDWLARVRFVKTDTEGNDDHVVASLRGLIAANRPVLFCEVYKGMPEERRRAFHTLLSEELGYRVHRAENWLAAEPLEAGDMMRHEHFDILCVPRERG